MPNQEGVALVVAFAPHTEISSCSNWIWSCFYTCYLLVTNFPPTFGLQANLTIQEAKLSVAQNDLNVAQAQLDAKQAELDKVQALYDKAVQEKQVIFAHAKRTFRVELS